MKISILGNGEFGMALNAHLSRLKHSISFDITNDSEIIFVAVPSYVVVSELVKNKENIKNQKIIIGSKGFASPEKLLSVALKEEFSNDIFFLYGPTLAEELTKGEISGMVLAGGDGKEELKKIIESENLHIELTEDIIGVQVGATLKNVVNIFVGIVEGAGHGQNTQAFILTRGVQEIQKIGIALGAESNTFIGLSCIGDLALRSRNRFLGIELGKGRDLDEVVSGMKINHTPEGITALKNAKSLVKKIGISAPFIESLYSIIFEKLNIDEAIRKIN